ncbi:MAG: response regulator [Anaerolineales bacterium]
MQNQKVHILVVEENPEIREQIEHQILKPLGYRVYSTPDASEGIAQAMTTKPDIIIADINLTGLSGKDMLVALSSQGIEAPVIILAEEGMEKEAIQAFRLGAVDYLKIPLKETEVVSAVERVLKTKQTQQTPTALPAQAQDKIKYLEDRIKDLTKVIGIAKTLVATKDPQSLYQKIIDGAVYVSKADRGWLMLREFDNKKLSLRYYNNLPNSLSTVLNKPWDDGISDLVMEARETLNLKEVKSRKKEISKLGKVVLGVPLFVHDSLLGTIVLIRKEPHPFSKSTQKIIETISEFASIALINAGFFEITKR